MEDLTGCVSFLTWRFKPNFGPLLLCDSDRFSGLVIVQCGTLRSLPFLLVLENIWEFFLMFSLPDQSIR